MGTPTTDRGGVQQALRALEAAGWRVHHVYDGEESTRVHSTHEAVEAVMAVDDATVHVREEGYDTSNRTSWIRFVLGNDPEEVICDYGMTLDSVLSALTDSWD